MSIHLINGVFINNTKNSYIIVMDTYYYYSKYMTKNYEYYYFNSNT